MGEKRKLLFATKYQLINAKEMIKLFKNHYLATITVITYSVQNHQ